MCLSGQNDKRRKGPCAKLRLAPAHSRVVSSFITLPWPRAQPRSPAALSARPATRRVSPNEKLNIAIIGAGGRGAADTAEVSSENIVALCDVNEDHLNAAAAKYPQARKYVDFRKLYDASKDIDAVVVATTEHTHAFAVMPAIHLGKHVFCEKPLAHSVWEARVIGQAATKAGIATQMGTQIHATDNYRRVVELIQTGAIGPVRDVHVWVSRAWGGGDRPTESVRGSTVFALGPLAGPSPGAAFSSELHQRPAAVVPVLGFRRRNADRTWAAIGTTCRSGRSSCATRSRSKPTARPSARKPLPLLTTSPTNMAHGATSHP